MQRNRKNQLQQQQGWHRSPVLCTSSPLPARSGCPTAPAAPASAAAQRSSWRCSNGRGRPSSHTAMVQAQQGRPLLRACIPVEKHCSGAGSHLASQAGQASPGIAAALARLCAPLQACLRQGRHPPPLKAEKRQVRPGQPQGTLEMPSVEQRGLVQHALLCGTSVGMSGAAGASSANRTPTE